MVIISLVAAGVGLAFDAYSERKARKEDERRRNSNDQIDEDIATAVSNVSRKQEEQEAFNELQNYANFQSKLSTRVLNDLSRGDTSMTNHDGQYPDKAHWERLEWPIVISQCDPPDGNRRWSRAYPRPLAKCGIDEATFLSFLDSFELHMTLSSSLEVVNMASVSSGAGQKGSPSDFSRVIPAAVQAMKAHQRDRKTDSFLNHANALTFRPRGLFTMLMTYKEDSPTQVITIDVALPVPTQHHEQDMPMSTKDRLTNSFQVESAPSNFKLGSPQQTHREEEETDRNFLQRKRYFERIPEMHAPRTKLIKLPNEFRASPSTDRGSMSNIASSVSKHRERKVVSEAVDKRMRRDKKPLFDSNKNLVSLAPGCESKAQYQTAHSQGDIKMENDMLYLVIVNDNQDELLFSCNMGSSNYSTMAHSQGSWKQTLEASYHPSFENSVAQPPAYCEKQ